MSTTRALDSMVTAYIGYRTAPRHSRAGDKAARRFHEAKREALRVAGSAAVARTLERITVV